MRLATWTASWGLPPSRRANVDALLSRASQLDWAFDWDIKQRRVVTQCITFGAQQLAALSDEELMAIVGTDTVEEAVECVIDTIGKLAEREVAGTAAVSDKTAPKR